MGIVLSSGVRERAHGGNTSRSSHCKLGGVDCAEKGRKIRMLRGLEDVLVQSKRVVDDGGPFQHLGLEQGWVQEQWQSLRITTNTRLQVVCGHRVKPHTNSAGTSKYAAGCADL